MAYVKVHTIQSAYGRLKYLFDEPAHDDSNERVLDTTGSNLRLWGPNDHPYAMQSGYYINLQFKQLRQQAYNVNKKTEAGHIIVSFDDMTEFPTDDPKLLHSEARQINQLVRIFMADHFPEAQYVSAAQCDGDGHKLHAHILLNTIATDGSCVRTNKLRIDNLRDQWNQCLEVHYIDVTGRPYHNPFIADNPATTTQPKGWQADLQHMLESARNKSTSIEEYKNYLATQGITIKTRNKKGDWSYGYIANGKQKTIRDFYQRRDKNTGLVTSTRGMGLAFTPLNLRHYFKFKQQSHQPSKTKSPLQRRAQRLDNQNHQDLLDELTAATNNPTMGPSATPSGHELDR